MLLPESGYCPVQMIWQHPEQAVNPRVRMQAVLQEGDSISERVIEGLGIERDWCNRYPGELSGGGTAAILHSEGSGGENAVSDCR